ncbi:hypothetical protein [Nitrosomonas sp.]|uniref:GapS1 family protein n=1 Tax=Nitrosomonas sp. TaxID=42353 RepID=UPI0025F90D0B|nr:hypothetical protein [Nitrosomonas sp.]
MSLQQYRSQKYQRKAHQIKKHLKCYDELDILNACADYIYAPIKEEIDHLQRQPWVVLLVLKWSFLDRSKEEIYRKDYLDSKKFYDVINRTYKLSNLIKMPHEYSHHLLFLRNIAYQQFIYQRPFSASMYGRQVNWFGNLPQNHTLRRRFKEIYGIECEDFLSLSLALITKFFDRSNHTIDLNWFSPIFPTFEPSYIERFLDSLSVDIVYISRELKEVNLSTGGYEEYYEQSPFARFPLIKHENKYTCIHPCILYRRLEYFIYDALKEDNPSKMMEYFSGLFESYLSKGLDYANLTYVTEKILKSNLPNHVKCVDYVVYDDYANIFIDAKAVEMPYLGKITGNPEIILNKVKSTAIKAVEQANRLNEYLFEIRSEKLPQFKKSNYLLVVTCKELYLGSGASLYDSIGKRKLDELYQTIPNEALIDPKHIYFISVDQFDFLMSIIKERNLSLKSLLDQVISEDANPSTRKFDFSQHIYSLDKQAIIPKYLEEEINSKFEYLKSFTINSISTG